MGVLAIYTADFDAANPSLFNFARSYGRQLQWVGASLVLGFIILVLDTRFFTAFAYPIYIFILALLLLVLVLGSTISGSLSWFRFGSMGMQPSEFAKVATSLAVAKYLSSSSLHTLREQVTIGALIFVPTSLILLQGDTGSALVFAALVLALYREGLSGIVLVVGLVMIGLFVLALLVNFNFLFLPIAFLIGLYLQQRERISQREQVVYWVIVAICVGLANVLSQPAFITFLIVTGSLLTFWFLNTRRIVYFFITFLLGISVYTKSVDYAFNYVLKPHQKNRIGVILGQVEDKQGVGYNLNQSKIAIGSGGVWGKGFLQGTQNKGNFVPELHTDFIFCTIGEEFGFVGSATVILLFLALFYRIITLAERQKSKFSRIYAYCVASILFFHFTINIGMTVGLIPVIGIPLPFISYGGSSLLAFTALTFILLKLDSERFLYL